MSELGKPFLKKNSDQKMEKQKIKVKMPHVNKKPLARKENLVQTKNTMPRMNHEWIGKTIKNKIRSKNRKNSKNQSEIFTCEQKTTSEKGKLGSNKKLFLERTMNGLGEPIRRKSGPKIEITVKIKVKFPHVNKKLLARTRIFVQTPFSHYFKI